MGTKLRVRGSPEMAAKKVASNDFWDITFNLNDKFNYLKKNILCFVYEQQNNSLLYWNIYFKLEKETIILTINLQIMSGYFSKESKKVRAEKYFKMGRMKFSILNSLFFAIGIIFFGSLFNYFIDKMFGASSEQIEIFTNKTLFRFIFMFGFWFISAYSYFWKEIVKQHNENTQSIQDKE